MEQKDYLLREIEKIGTVLRAILKRLLIDKGNDSITVNNQTEALKELLLNEVNLNLDNIIDLENAELEKQFSLSKGYNTANIELLANVIAQVGLNMKMPAREKYLEKALYLYNFCNSMDKTFSIERENNIRTIKEELN